MKKDKSTGLFLPDGVTAPRKGGKHCSFHCKKCGFTEFGDKFEVKKIKKEHKKGCRMYAIKDPATGIRRMVRAQVVDKDIAANREKLIKRIERRKAEFDKVQNVLNNRARKEKAALDKGLENLGKKSIKIL